MTDLRKAAEMALDALEKGTTGLAIRAIPALRQALAQPEQKLIGWKDGEPQYVAQPEQDCAECGVKAIDGYALYCVACTEKFVGGYKENVPVHTSELLTQVFTGNHYSGNGTAGVQNETKPIGFFFQMPPKQEPFARLLRIMGTFDLATGHSDNWNGLLDSLEQELRDVLGHYREALKAQPEQEPICRADGRCQYAIDHGAEGLGHCPQGKCCMPQPEPEPVAWMLPDYGDVLSANEADGTGIYNIPLYTAPPKRKWIGLTEEEIKKIMQRWRGGYIDIKDVEQLLKEKNT